MTKKLIRLRGCAGWSAALMLTLSWQSQVPIMPYSATKRVETKYDTLPATANNGILGHCSKWTKSGTLGTQWEGSVVF